MAFASVGSLGTASSNSADQSSLAFTTSATLEAGNLAVLIIAVDNHATTDGDEGAVSSVTDSAGNTWAKALEYSDSGGALQAGTVCSIWYTRATTQLNSGATITVNYTNSTSRDASCATAWEYTVGAAVAVEATATEAVNAADVGSLNPPTANIECLRVRGISMETNNGTALTATSGWTAFTGTQTSVAGGASANQAVRGEFKISTGTGDASDPNASNNPPEKASCYIAFKEVATQDLTPSLFSDTDSFFGPTAAASYALTPSLFSEADTFFAPVVQQGIQELFPSLFSEADAFFAVTVTASYALTPDLFSESDAFFDPAASYSYALTPDLFSESDAFFAAAITTGVVDVAPDLFVEADAFFAVTVAASYALTPDLFSETDAFFDPAATYSYALNPALFDEADAFFAAAITTVVVDVAPDLFAESDAFFAVTVTAGYTLAPDLFAESDAFFAAAVTVGPVDVAPSLFGDTDVFYSPVIPQPYVRRRAGRGFTYY